jgi:hypothetical protein
MIVFVALSLSPSWSQCWNVTSFTDCSGTRLIHSHCPIVSSKTFCSQRTMKNQHAEFPLLFSDDLVYHKTCSHATQSGLHYYTLPQPSLDYTRKGIMARLRRVIDMGMYSPLHKHLHDRLYDDDRQAKGPISCRTRSQTKSQNDDATLTPPKNSPTLGSSKITKLRAPSTGSLTQTRPRRQQTPSYTP